MEKKRVSAKKTPKISIVTPVLNCAKFITETVESVLMQTYKDWEWIIVDGNSTDGTLEILERYASKNKNIRVYSAPTKTSFEAFDKAMKQATGEFLCFPCGQDGFLDRDWFKKSMEIFERDKDVSLVWGLVKGKTEEGEFFETNDTYLHFIEDRNFFDVVKIAFRKAFLILKDFIFGSLQTKKFILKKVFSKGARLRMQALTRPGFKGHYPQKQEWFLYWLNTGLAFPDQSIMVSKKVYLDCAPRYNEGEIPKDNWGDFFYNFNSRGYMAYYVPTYVNFGRMHKGNFSEKEPVMLYEIMQSYLERVASLRERILVHHEPIIFRDRDNKVIDKKVF